MHAVIIGGSPHRRGNLATFSAIVAGELTAHGHSVETVELYDIRLGPCRSCDGCSASGRCSLRDGFTTLAQQLVAADLLIFATPVYWFSVSGVMKTLMDRTQSLWHGRQLRGRAGAALVVQAHAGADETCALLASFCKYHAMRWLGCSTVRTRDQRDLVAGAPELQRQAREFARELHTAMASQASRGGA